MIKKWLIGTEQSIKRNSFIWNAIGAALNAGQSALVLFFVTRVFGLEMAGVVTIAYAIANLFQTMGRYGIRNYQVTDTKERFTFADYFYCRIITVGATFIIAVIYLILCRNFADYSLEKTIIIFEVVVLKLADAFAEVYIGRYQQVGRLDIAAKIHALELMLSTAAMCLMLFLGIDLYWSVLVGIIVTLLVNFVGFHYTLFLVDARIRQVCTKNIRTILRIGISLCIGLTLYMYIGNAPKYLIDLYMDERSQAIFGYVMMPMFVITLLNNFLLQPVLKELGDVWGKSDLPKFKKMVLRQYLVIWCMALVVLLAGLWLGLPLLSVFYGVELTGYGREFSFLMIGAAFYTVAYYMSVVLTTIRRQNLIVVGYVAAVGVYLFLGGTFIHTWGMLGAAYLYLIANALTAIMFTLFVIQGIRRYQNT